MALKEALKKRKSKQISIDSLIKLAKSGEVKQQISGNAIGRTTFASPYACIFMDQVESEYSKTQ